MSAIEWTDKTVNVQIGCSRVSPGCENCYAETQANALARRFGKPGQAGHRYLPVVDGKGRWSRKVVLDLDALARPPYEHGIPKRKRDGKGWRRPRVFLGSMTDHFHEQVTPGGLIAVMHWMSGSEQVYQHPSPIWQLVTKRPERAAGLLSAAWEDHLLAWPWPTIHLLATVEDQQRADERVPALLEAAPYVDIVGLSVEPLLGPVTIPHLDKLGWVIVGGESGPGARPCAVEWIRDVVRQCATAGVPCFVKQIGARPMRRGETVDLAHSKGGDMNEWPTPDLRVRQWPA